MTTVYNGEGRSTTDFLAVLIGIASRHQPARGSLPGQPGAQGFRRVQQPSAVMNSVSVVPDVLSWLTFVVASERWKFAIHLDWYQFQFLCSHLAKTQLLEMRRVDIPETWTSRNSTVCI